jgi:hypothetical protein
MATNLALKVLMPQEAGETAYGNSHAHCLPHERESLTTPLARQLTRRLPTKARALGPRRSPWPEGQRDGREAEGACERRRAVDQRVRSGPERHSNRHLALGPELAKHASICSELGRSLILKPET